MTPGPTDAIDVKLRPNGDFSDEALAALFVASWPEGTTARLSLDRSLCWVSAHVGERLVGFVNVVGDGGVHAFVIDTTVHPEFRRHGVGTALVRCALEEARDLGAETVHVDFEARHANFYRRCGFRPSPAGLWRSTDAPVTDPERVTLRKYATTDAGACRSVFDGLPAWFGIPSAVEAYLADLPRLPTWVASVGDEQVLAGFVSLTAPQAKAFEVHVLAVARAQHRRGVGRALMEHVERWSAARGARFLHVKTLGLSHPDPAYAETRSFYQRLGYEALLETDKLWGEGNPTLLLVKALI